MSAEAPAKDAKAEATIAGGLWEQIGTIGLAIVIALGVRAFVVEPFRIPSGSMLPTLLIGDHLFVNKFVYGIKIPFTDVRFSGLREPKRGDVIVFTVAKDGSGATHPADLRPDQPTEEFVKRIVGLPGDEIEFRDGEILINGEPVEEKPLGETFDDGMGRPLDVREVAFEERTFRILDDPGSPPHPRSVTTVVDEGRYFVLGDNRDHSKDSRFWGTVRLEEIKGPAFVLYWSWDFNGTWAQLVNPVTWWATPKRWDRIGAAIQ